VKWIDQVLECTLERMPEPVAEAAPAQPDAAMSGVGDGSAPSW